MSDSPKMNSSIFIKPLSASPLKISVTNKYATNGKGGLLKTTFFSLFRNIDCIS